MRMDARARQDVAFLGSEFLKLDGKILYPIFKLLHYDKRTIFNCLFAIFMLGIKVQYFDVYCLDSGIGEGDS